MKMAELLRFGAAPEIISLWQERESEHLLPLQEMAVRQHGLFERKNLLIQAPTTSGKTFIGEMAALHTALKRKKVVYLLPLKALAAEKWAGFQEKYAAYGIKTIISTRDHREFDEDLEKGNFSIAVVVYEKLAQLLVRRPERINELELVIADELEILSDPERGAMAELLLTRLLLAGVRLIGLSAVIGGTERLARWMNAEAVLFERRPIELRYGVLHEGVFRFRTYNEYAEAEEKLADCESESPWEILSENLHAFVKAGEPCIIFVKDRYESRRGAALLAHRLDLPPATTAIEALRRLDATHARDELSELLNLGVAFHNADLSPEERQVIETAFRSEELKVLVSTSTLAAGMNLPAQNVFITADKWQYDTRFGMPWKTPILRAEYENMGGRAGRYGSGKPFGRSILVAATPFDHETLWRRYVEGEREAIEPRLGQGPLEDHVLRLVASSACRTEEELVRFFNHTPTGMWVWAESLSPQEIEVRVRTAINRATDAGLLAPANEQGHIEATPFGWAAASKGVSLATARELASWVRESETRLWGDIDLLLAAALTPDGRMVQVSLTTREYDHADYPEQLRQGTRNEELSSDVPLNRLRNCTLMPFFNEVRAIKIALFLQDWLNEESIYDIEERYQTLLGQIRGAADQLSWLVDATAAIARAFGAHEAFIRRIELLAERTARGLRAETLPLARLAGPILSRAALVSMASAGLHTAETLAQTPPERLKHWMPLSAARRIAAWALESTGLKPETAMPIPRDEPVLIVDGRRPCQIEFEGKVVPLQDKQYRMMELLAAHPGECVFYEALQDALWGETAVEPNQIHVQKRRLLERIHESAPEYARYIRTIPRRGLLLDLTPEQVRFTASRQILCAAVG